MIMWISRTVPKAKRSFGRSIFVLLLLLLLFVLVVPASAEHSGVWNTLSWTLTDDGLLTISGEGSMDHLWWDTDAWRAYAPKIRKVEIREGVTCVGESAFLNCVNITDVVLADSVTSIKSSAFCLCKSLKNIQIPDSVKEIGDEAFFSCESLESILLPDHITEFDYATFSQCDAVLYASFGSETAKALGRESYSFKVTGQPSELLYLYDEEGVSGLRMISYDHEGITSATIPDGVTEIGEGVFRDCATLTGVTFPQGLTVIRDGAFENCISLSGIVFPDSLQYIGYAAFENCIGLSGIVFPDGLQEICGNAFQGCENLGDVTLPDGIQYVGFGSFPSYDKTAIYANLGSNAAKAVSASYRYFKVPGTGNEFQYSFTDHEVTGLGFMHCDPDATEVTVPTGVTFIGSGAFYECKALKSVYLPDGVTRIGDRAFMECTSLESIRIPESVTVIEQEVFWDCDSLKEITLPSTITTIEERLFSDCDSLTSFHIPEGVTTIKAEAFRWDTKLASLSLPDSVTAIDDTAIPYCCILTVGADSYALQYALTHGYTYVIRGQEKPRQTGATTVEDKIREIIANEITPGMSDYQKAIVLHNWLVRNVEYDYTYSHYYTADALLEGTAVCNGYALAYAALLDAVGIENTFGNGDNHIWNVVKLEGDWCHIDVTWDDSGQDLYYFGLTDYALQDSGPSHSNDYPQQTCNNYRLSMAYRTGELDRIIRKWTEEMTEHMRKGETGYQLSIYKEIPYSMAIEMLKETGMTIDGTTYPIRIITKKTEGYGTNLMLSLKTGADARLLGDVNGDGTVDGRDSIRLMKYLAGEIDPETGELYRINAETADMNEDGEINELDLLRLMKLLAS